MKALKNSSNQAVSLSSGKAHAGADGDPCCCTCDPIYIPARKCSDDSLATVGMSAADAATITGSFKYGGFCYYFGEDDPECKPPGDSLLTPGDVEEFDDCEGCESECLCNYDLVVTVGAPYPPEKWGTYDLINTAGCVNDPTQLHWETTDFSLDDATGAAMDWSSDAGGRYALGVKVTGDDSATAVATAEFLDQVGPCPDEVDWGPGITVVAA